MESKIKVALDVDGVLANFYKTVCKKYDKPYETVKEFYVPWLTKVWMSDLQNNDDFWKSLDVLNEAYNISFDFDMYLTSVPDDMFSARVDWLYKNGYPPKPVEISHKKADFCVKHQVDLLIDDKPQTIEECVKKQVFAIQFIPYYSEMPFKTAQTVRHLYEVNKYIEVIQKFKNIPNLSKEWKDIVYDDFYRYSFLNFKNLVGILHQLLVQCSTAEQIWETVNRWEADRLYRHFTKQCRTFPDYVQNGIFALTESCKDSL